MVVKELYAKLGMDFDENSFKAAEALIGGLKQGLLGILGGVAAVAAGMLEMGRETANAGNDAYKLSVRLGTTTDAAQELAHAAEAAGSSADTLQTSMFHMSRAIESAKEGSVEARRALTGLGVPLQELVGLKPDEQFTRLAGGLSKVANENQRAEKAQAIFGRGVIDLLPLISKGEDGIRDFREEAHKMGLVLSTEVIEESREWKRELREAGEQVDALKFTVGSFVLKGLLAMTRAWRSVKKSFTDWVAVHPDRALNIVKTALFALSAATAAWALVNAEAIAASIIGYARMAAVAVFAAARATVAFAFVNAELIALGVAIFGTILVLDDLYHWFKGDKATFIGSKIKGWKDDLADFTKDLNNFLNLQDYNKRQKRADSKWEKETLPEINQRTEDRRRIREGLGEDISGFSSIGMVPGQTFAPSVPSVAFPGAGVVAPSFQANFNITAPAGTDAKEIAGQVRSTLEDWHHSKVREAIAHVE